MRGFKDPQHVAEHLDTIISQSERLTRLLNNVLNFSKIERGQADYHMKLTRLDDVVRSTARNMEFPLAEQGFNLNVDICCDLPPMHVDCDAIEQAILNLITNAMKYSGKSRDIILRMDSANGSALIQVADRGIGIAPGQQKRIFEKFYRVESPESSAASGVGIGLALVAHIARGHGGSVEVASELGKGSTFTIRLPIHENGNS
jgi:signal transduction histidine kinase